MADKPKPVDRANSGLTRPGELYVQGDKLPVPDVEERNTDSVWALWSDLVEEKSDAPDRANNDRDRAFLETVPLDLNAQGETRLKDLPNFSPKQDK